MKITKLCFSLCLTLLAGIFLYSSVSAQPTSLTKDEMLYYTSLWKGERFPDGRPKVSDDIIQTKKYVSVTEAWQILNGLRDTEGQGPVSFGEFRRST